MGCVVDSVTVPSSSTLLTVMVTMMRVVRAGRVRGVDVHDVAVGPRFVVQRGLGPQLAGGRVNVEGRRVDGVQGVGQGVVIVVGGRDGSADVHARHVFSSTSWRSGSMGVNTGASFRSAT